MAGRNRWTQPPHEQVWTHEQENSDSNQKISNPSHLWEDNKQEESKKKGKNTGPNSTNVTKSMDGVYSSEEKQRSNVIPKEEDYDGSYGGTRPDSTKNKGNHGGTRSDPTKSSTFEQTGPGKEKENDRIKNKQDDILEEHHKAVHKPEYNHRTDRDKGNHGGTRSDPTKSSTLENDHIKNRHEGILEDHDHHKGVHKPEYNHGPDLTKKESSSLDSEQASVQKRRGKQSINTNDEYTNPTNPSTTITSREEQRRGVVHQQDNNANKQDTKPDATRNSVGPATKEQHRGTQKTSNETKCSCNVI